MHVPSTVEHCDKQAQIGKIFNSPHCPPPKDFEKLNELKEKDHPTNYKFNFKSRFGLETMKFT